MRIGVALCTQFWTIRMVDVSTVLEKVIPGVSARLEREVNRETREMKKKNPRWRKPLGYV